MSRTCSQCGNNGHNSRTCTEVCGRGNGCSAAGENAIMLFGVRVTEAASSFRKSASMNNISQYDQAAQDSNGADAGYASDDIVHASGRSRERKRGINFSCSESDLFLVRFFGLIFFLIFSLIRCSVDGGRAQAVLVGIAEGREGRLERNL